MRTFINLWKRFANRAPRTYLCVCWILLGLIGTMAGLGVEWTALLVLIPGYFMNIIWMMRQSE